MAREGRGNFASQLRDTNYKKVWDKNIKQIFEIFLSKLDYGDKFHHAIVIKGSSCKYGRNGYVTLEISKEKKTSSKLEAYSGVYQGNIDDLQSVGEIEKIKLPVDDGKEIEYRLTIEILAAIADSILEQMEEEGGYNLATNNCQTFCNHFLDAIGLSEETYLTTPQIFAIAAGIAGIAAGITGGLGIVRSSFSQK